MTQDTRRFVSQKTGNLYIAKVESSDVGNYTCVVTNTVTKTTVQGPPTPLVLRVDGGLLIHTVAYMHHHTLITIFCVSKMKVTQTTPDLE